MNFATDSTSAGLPPTLVWGACGFVGRHLTARLLDLGARVTVLTRSRENYSEPEWAGRVRWLEFPKLGDRRAVLAEALSESRLVYDLAGSTGAARSNREPLRSLEEHNRSQLEFLEACRAAGSSPHIVFTSSRLVYGSRPRLPVAETHAVDPRSAYAAHKLCCEQYLRIFADLGALSFTVARISNVYGWDPDSERKNHGILNAFVEAGKRGEPLTLFGDGSQLRDYIYVDDAVEALVLCGLAGAARDELFNLGSGRGMRIREAAWTIGQRTGAGVRHLPWPREFRQVETGDFVADVRKIRRALGFWPRYTFAAGLDAMLAARAGHQP